MLFCFAFLVDETILFPVARKWKVCVAIGALIIFVGLVMLLVGSVLVHNMDDPLSTRVGCSTNVNPSAQCISERCIKIKIFFVRELHNFFKKPIINIVNKTWTEPLLEPNFHWKCYILNKFTMVKNLKMSMIWKRSQWKYKWSQYINIFIFYFFYRKRHFYEICTYPGNYSVIKNPLVLKVKK